ncbi:MAG: CBS domain-containing protein [Rhodospirillales bacterium]|nr:CBS domain-containing protein [Rhodospirillales bacterium]MBO6786240.1 CBS domain-containing protein [Rhodospirillales bacterium]
MDTDAWDDIVRNDVNDVLQGTDSLEDEISTVRPWPPIMIRDFVHAYDLSTKAVDAGCTVGYVADYLSETPGASVAVYDDDGDFLGLAVDDDVMALIKRDGVRALDYPIIEAVQRQRPVCSICDSPMVILQLMRSGGWDRVGVSAGGRVIGVLRRRDFVNFTLN